MTPKKFDSEVTRRQFLGKSSALLSFAAMGGLSTLLSACGDDAAPGTTAAPVQLRPPVQLRRRPLLRPPAARMANWEC